MERKTNQEAEIKAAEREGYIRRENELERNRQTGRGSRHKSMPTYAQTHTSTQDAAKIHDRRDFRESISIPHCILHNKLCSNYVMLYSHILIGDGQGN